MKRTFAFLLLCLSALTTTTAARTFHGGAPDAVRATPIVLQVDATEVARKIFHVRETIPASAGPLTLFYPKWIPGEHGPTGPITDLVGVRITAAGKPVEWRRDPVDMYAFHCEVPAGASSVEVALDFLSATSDVGFTSAASVTPHLAIVTWNQLLLYPQGANTDDLSYKASLRLPAGWKYGTSLAVAGNADNVADFAPVSLTTLVDSPVLAGEYFRVVPLNDERPSVELDIAADSPAALEITPELTSHMRQLVKEAKALFGAQHFENYHFLLTLSDHVAHFGLEHHQSNDSRVAERSLIKKDLGELSLGVLPHEYVHSWNGKFRRPAGLATPDFQQPMQGELLWVYEGLTQYLGNLLAARSGLWTPEQYRNQLAQVAADLDHRPGRAWRPLVDTTTAAQLLYGSASEWRAERRGVDFYDEGWLVWLDADTLIRQQTNGRRSLDDFCRLFHGGQSGAPTVKTYTFDDVVNTLNEVAPSDWRTFLTTRLNTTQPRAPLGGVERGGWRLIYNDAPNHSLELLEEYRKLTEAGYSVGLRIREDGTIQDAITGMLASQAGIGPGMKLVAVNGRKWSADVLRDALKASRNSSGTLDLLVENNEFYKTFALNYHDGLRQPHLEREASKADILTRLIAPLTSRSGR
jgi:predicted metalloprotease with PDZ domain